MGYYITLLIISSIEYYSDITSWQISSRYNTNNNNNDNDP